MGVVREESRSARGRLPQAMFLQMACEKLCKAHLIVSGSAPEDLQSSHAYVTKHLPNVFKNQLSRRGASPKNPRGLLTQIRHLAHEIEILNPAVDRDRQRPDNCEYPWRAGAEVKSPLSWTFDTLRLCRVNHGPTFLKMLRRAIDKIRADLES